MELRKFALTFFTLFTTIYIQKSTADTSINTTDFYDYIEIVSKLSTVAAKLRVLKAVWAEVRADYRNDLKAVESLHKVLHDICAQQNTSSVAVYAAQQQEFHEFYQEIRQVIITQNGQQLAQIMNIEVEAPLEYEAEHMIAKIMNKFNYDPNVAYKIFLVALDQICALKSPYELAMFLRSLEHNDDGTAANKELLYHAQLYLYWKFVERRDIDDAYLLYIAYYMLEAKSSKLVKSSCTEERRLDEAIKSLPSSVQNLFFTKNICLLNAYHYEYLYEILYGDAQDAQRKFILTWRTPKSVGTNGPFNIELTKTNATIAGHLHSVMFNHYMYRDQKANNMLYAWNTMGQKPSNSLWTLSLNDNKLRLYQDDLYLCAAEGRDKDRRYVRGIQQAATNVSSVCEWYIDNCPTVYG